MSNAIEGLKPELVWKYFAEISRIPRGSKNEAAATQYILDTAAKLGLPAKADSFGNVVVRKPASGGRQNVRSIALQSHLDMVCEKNKDKVHDFLKDPIELVRNGNFLTANGTTLGADNGIGVATNLALMEDRSLEHGPLEFLFTVDEETGLTGASNLAADMLESRILLNLDSEEEGEITVGCAGGRDTMGTWKMQFEPAPAGLKVMQVKVTGLKGGHSGIEIDKGRGNAVKIMNRALLVLSQNGARLAAIDGGDKHNAIPRECEAVVFIPPRKIKKARNLIEKVCATIQAEIATVDPDLLVELAEINPGNSPAVMRKSAQRKLLKTISALPHGVTKMSADIPNLVETSTNLALIKTLEGSVRIITSQRSSVASEIEEIVDSVSAAFELGGASIEHTHGYPGWKPNMDSPILKTAKSTYHSLFGKEPIVKAIHAGLECGVIGERILGMDMISFGPTMEAVHSPDERVHIDTVEKFWVFLLQLLKSAN
ncbi:MAG: aminoacyl-histidine dipeptidase [Acidobacteria bacterium]|nr:aminoacyl-histidine dipeptidase [Acidobacteriota bacterium]